MRILAVEDDRRIATDIKAALTSAGFPWSIPTAKRLRFLGDTEDYALVVLDLGLPDMDEYRCSRGGARRTGTCRCAGAVGSRNMARTC